MLKKLSELRVRPLGAPAVGSGRKQRRLRQGRPGIESLEERALMSAFDESGDAVVVEQHTPRPEMPVSRPQLVCPGRPTAMLRSSL